MVASKGATHTEVPHHAQLTLGCSKGVYIYLEGAPWGPYNRTKCITILQCTTVCIASWQKYMQLSLCLENLAKTLNIVYSAMGERKAVPNITPYNGWLILFTLFNLKLFDLITFYFKFASNPKFTVRPPLQYIKEWKFGIHFLYSNQFLSMKLKLLLKYSTCKCTTPFNSYSLQ